MLLNLNVPRINEYMTNVFVEAAYAEAGQAVAIGAKLFDLTVDLSAAAPHDCPPITHYRVVSRERAWMRSLCVKPHDEPAVGAPLALLTTEPDEALEGAPARPARVAIAAIMHQSIWGVR